MLRLLCMHCIFCGHHQQECPSKNLLLPRSNGMLHTLRPSPGARQRRKRVGRGISAGGGKTAGRGTKGQKARGGSGRKVQEWFEGGQTPLYRTAAKKRGFNHKVTKNIAVTTDVINHFFKDGETVSP